MPYFLIKDCEDGHIFDKRIRNGVVQIKDLEQLKQVRKEKRFVEITKETAQEIIYPIPLGDV